MHVTQQSYTHIHFLPGIYIYSGVYILVCIGYGGDDGSMDTIRCRREAVLK